MHTTPAEIQFIAMGRSVAVLVAFMVAGAMVLVILVVKLLA